MDTLTQENHNCHRPPPHAVRWCYTKSAPDPGLVSELERLGVAVTRGRQQHRLLAQAIDDAHYATLRLQAAAATAAKFRPEVSEVAGEAVTDLDLDAARRLALRIAAALREWNAEIVAP